ncbi:unnamed protein product [Thelazia callipaeda]|uniref:DNA-directed RNA polymerase n=1 Tax=Thelazia callipaeda TaxID=103827 RepID=A0A158RCN9_THECL|nr:unnamed protein product [Thelazia callipaeda]
MFVIPYYEPAVEIYSPTESANLEECNMLEQRLQFLGIKSSSIQRELGVGRNSHIENKVPKSEIMINPFESLKLQQNVKRIEVKKEKGSVRSWLWLQYLSYHGNCSLCDRPLNAHFEEIVMQRCAHALHLECAEEIRQNRHVKSKKMISEMKKDIKEVRAVKDKWELVPAFLRVRGLVKQHIASYDYFVNTDIKKILQANNKITSDANPSFYLKYLDIRVGMPASEEGFNQINHNINPHECRLRDMTYSAPISVDIEYTRGSQRVLRNDLVIGKMPVMLRSSRCVLKDMNERELAFVQECPYDPGGYFIVRGSEKVVLIQEQLSKNRIMIGRNSKKELQCEVLSSTQERKSKTYITSKKQRYYVRHNQLSDDVPVSIVFKAMGFESDHDIVSTVGSEEKFVAALAPSIEECTSHQIATQEGALQYIASKVKMKKFGVANSVTPSLPREHEAIDFLSNSMIAHVPCPDGNMKMKAIYLGLMIRR